MSATDADATDVMDDSLTAVQDGVVIHTPSQTVPVPGAAYQPSAQAVPEPPKRRMVITHDKYMALQSLIVLHLSAIEQETGKGMDRDDLIDWYLELKEGEIQDSEELKYEEELITKMLKKLVKVCLRDPFLWDFNFMTCYRTTTSSKSRAMSKNHFHLWTTRVKTLQVLRRVRMFGCSTWFIRLSIRRVRRL
jgi:hypothetical protein